MYNWYIFINVLNWLIENWIKSFFNVDWFDVGKFFGWVLNIWFMWVMYDLMVFFDGGGLFGK